MKNKRMLKILVGIFFTMSFAVPVFARKKVTFPTKKVVLKEKDRTSIFSYLFRNKNEIDLGYVNTRRFPGGKKDKTALIRAKQMFKNSILNMYKEYPKFVKYFKMNNINSLKEITDKKHFSPIFKLILEYKEKQKQKIKSNLNSWFKHIKSEGFKNEYEEKIKRELGNLKACLKFSSKNPGKQDKKTKEAEMKLIKKINKVKKDLKNLKKSKYLQDPKFEEYAKNQKESLKRKLEMLNLEITHIKQILSDKEILEISRTNFAKYVKEADRDEGSNFDEDIKKIIKGEKVLRVALKKSEAKIKKI